MTSMNELESELKKISDQISTTAKALRVIQKTAEEDAFALKKLRQKIEKAETEEEKVRGWKRPLIPNVMKGRSPFTNTATLF